MSDKPAHRRHRTVPRAGVGRRRAVPDPDAAGGARRLMWVTVPGALVAVVLAVVAVVDLGGGDGRTPSDSVAPSGPVASQNAGSASQGPGSASQNTGPTSRTAGPTSRTAGSASQGSGSASRTSGSASPGGGPSAVPPPFAPAPGGRTTVGPTPVAPGPAARPVDVLAGLRATVAGLVRDGQLSARDGAGLDRRLREVGDRLADGRVDLVRVRLRAFTVKLDALRRRARLSAAGHQVLADGAAQLTAVLPQG